LIYFYFDSSKFKKFKLKKRMMNFKIEIEKLV